MPRKNTLTSRSKGRQTGLVYEALEDRKLLATTAVLSGFVLRVDGDNSNNGISIETSANDPYIVVNRKSSTMTTL